MTTYELERELYRLDIPQNYYAILPGGISDGCYCLIHPEENLWRVYCGIHGEKKRIYDFLTEDAACLFMLLKLEKYANNHN